MTPFNTRSSSLPGTGTKTETFRSVSDVATTCPLSRLPYGRLTTRVRPSFSHSCWNSHPLICLSVRGSQYRVRSRQRYPTYLFGRRVGIRGTSHPKPTSRKSNSPPVPSSSEFVRCPGPICWVSLEGPSENLLRRVT